jgi:hypothetical protein
VTQIAPWFGTIAQLIGAALMASRLSPPPIAYSLMLAGSLAWAAIAAGRADWPLFTLNAAFSAINIVGLARWSGETRRPLPLKV